MTLALPEPRDNMNGTTRTNRRHHSRGTLAGAMALLLLSSIGCGYVVRQGMIAYLKVRSEITPNEIEIELEKSFVEKYKDRVGIAATFTVDASAPGPAIREIDGDLHFVGRAPEIDLVAVAELANADSYKAAVDRVHEADSTRKPVSITGVWRIWPEHAGHGTVQQGKPVLRPDTYRPDHVFEIHPVTRLDRISLLGSFTPVKGFSPGDAHDTFGIYERVPCKIVVTPATISITTRKGLYNDVEFLLQLTDDPQHVVADGRFVLASALDMNGQVVAERVRMVFAKGTPPDQAVRRLKPGDRLHVFGIPRVSFAELSRRVAVSASDPAQLSRTLPYEIVVLGVFAPGTGRS